MAVCCAVGSNAKLSINGTRVNFTSFDGSRVAKSLTDGSVRAIRGEFDHTNTDVVDGLLFANYRVTMHLTSAKAALLLPLMGFTVSGVTPPVTHTITDTLTEFDTVLTTDGGLDFTFDDGKVGRWMITGQKGTEPIRLELEIACKNMTTAAVGTFTHGAMTSGSPYAFHAATLLTGADTQLFDRFALAVDHGLIVEHNNSQTATQICGSDREITLGTSFPFSTCSDTTDFVTGPLAGLVDTTGTLTLTNSTLSTKFELASLIQTMTVPSVHKKKELTRLPLHWRGYKTSSTASIRVTNDNTP